MNRTKEAQRFLNAGINIFPLNPDKSPPWKWKHLQKRFATKDEIDFWFQEGQPFEIAVIGGKVSGWLTVFDFDEKNGAGIYAAWKKQMLRYVPHLMEILPVVRTPSGGYHIYFRAACCFKNCGLAFNKTGGKTIEIKSEGGYVLAPGKHCYGEYKVLANDPLNPPYLTKYGVNALLTFADKLNRFDRRQFLNTATVKVDLASAVKHPLLPALKERIRKAKRHLDSSPASVQGRNADGYVFALACSLVWDYALPQDAAIELLYEWGQNGKDSSGAPYPWSEAEITHKVVSALNTKHSGRCGSRLVPEIRLMEYEVNQLFGIQFSPRKRIERDQDAIDDWCQDLFNDYEDLMFLNLSQQ